MSRTADVREIRGAFRRLAKQYHPDLNDSPDAVEQMARINWAYAVAMEHARHEGPRVYRGASHRAQPRASRVRWYVRQRPPPAGGRLVIETPTVVLHGQRGDNANVEGVLMVRNEGIGPLEGEVKATPAYVIVRPKQFTLQPREAQMFRVSVPNRYCGEEPGEAALTFEWNGGDNRVAIGLPRAGEVLLALEPPIVDLGQIEPGGERDARVRLTYRGKGVPRLTLSSDAPWLTILAVGLPRRTQYFRLTARAPDAAGPHVATLVAHAGGATASATLRLEVAAPA